MILTDRAQGLANIASLEAARSKSLGDTVVITVHNRYLEPLATRTTQPSNTFPVETAPDRVNLLAEAFQLAYASAFLTRGAGKSATDNDSGIEAYLRSKNDRPTIAYGLASADIIPMSFTTPDKKLIVTTVPVQMSGDTIYEARRISNIAVNLDQMRIPILVNESNAGLFLLAKLVKAYKQISLQSPRRGTGGAIIIAHPDLPTTLGHGKLRRPVRIASQRVGKENLGVDDTVESKVHAVCSTNAPSRFARESLPDMFDGTVTNIAGGLPVRVDYYGRYPQKIVSAAVGGLESHEDESVIEMAIKNFNDAFNGICALAVVKSFI